MGYSESSASQYSLSMYIDGELTQDEVDQVERELEISEKNRLQLGELLKTRGSVQELMLNMKAGLGYERLVGFVKEWKLSQEDIEQQEKARLEILEIQDGVSELRRSLADIDGTMKEFHGFIRRLEERGGEQRRRFHAIEKKANEIKRLLRDSVDEEILSKLEYELEDGKRSIIDHEVELLEEMQKIVLGLSKALNNKRGF